MPLIDESLPKTDDDLLTWEYPGILVLNGAHEGGDIGIDALDGETWRVFVYKRTWGEADPETVGILECAIQHDPEASARMLGDSVLAAGAQPDSYFLLLPDGCCLLITRGHVFMYWCDDGGACVGIVHRVPHGGGECDALCCDADLVVNE